MVSGSFRWEGRQGRMEQERVLNVLSMSFYQCCGESVARKDSVQRRGRVRAVH